MSRHPRHRKESSPSLISRRTILTGSAAAALTATGILSIVSEGPAPTAMGNQDALLLTPAPQPEPALTETFDDLLPAKPVERPHPRPARKTRPAKPKPEPAPKPKPKPVTNRRALLRTARSLFGVPYLYGGNTPKTGLDCSGYTRWVFARHGLRLPRTAHEQSRYCNRVSSPIPGDLVFFHYANGHVHHVGIYVAPGRMYDAPHTGSFVGEHSIYSGHFFGRHPRL